MGHQDVIKHFSVWPLSLKHRDATRFIIPRLFYKILYSNFIHSTTIKRYLNVFLWHNLTKHYIRRAKQHQYGLLTLLQASYFFLTLDQSFSFTWFLACMDLSIWATN